MIFGCSSMWDKSASWFGTEAFCMWQTSIFFFTFECPFSRTEGELFWPSFVSCLSVCLSFWKLYSCDFSSRRRVGSYGPAVKLQNFQTGHFHTKVAVVIWWKNCRYGVKLEPINHIKDHALRQWDNKRYRYKTLIYWHLFKILQSKCSPVAKGN